LWEKATSTVLAAKCPRQDNPAPAGWNNCWFNKTIHVTGGSILRIAFLKSGQFTRTNNGLVAPVTHGNIKFIESFQSTTSNPPQAAITLNTNLNGVDVLFDAD
jgi:hypothetical protein